MKVYLVERPATNWCQDYAMVDDYKEYPKDYE